MRPAAAILRELAHDRHSDGELLSQFLSDRSEPAFQELIRRHGPLVWAACRRLLPDPADAEDAFQAAFLVLVRHARKLSAAATVGPWLYKVAVWTARNARRKNARRLARQHPLPEQLPTTPSDADLRADLDTALLALPARYRDSIVLCHLQGFTRTEAAARLGCAEGTLSAWLNRGLAKLRSRLRNLDPTALLVPGALVPAALSAATARAAASTSLAGAAVPPAVSYLVEGVLHMFWVKKATAAAFAVCAVFALGVGAGLGTRPGSVGLGAQEKGPEVPDGMPPTPEPKRGPGERPKEARGNDAVAVAAELQFIKLRIELARQELKKAEDRLDGAASEVVAEALRSQIARYEARRAVLLKAADPKPNPPALPEGAADRWFALRNADLRSERLKLQAADARDQVEALKQAAGDRPTDRETAAILEATRRAAELNERAERAAAEVRALQAQLIPGPSADPYRAELAAIEAFLVRARPALKRLEGDDLAALRTQIAQLEAQRAELVRKVAARKANIGWVINVRVALTAQGRIEYIVEEHRDDPRLSDQPGAVRTEDRWALALLLQHAKADPNGPGRVQITIDPRAALSTAAVDALRACDGAGYTTVTFTGYVFGGGFAQKLAADQTGEVKGYKRYDAIEQNAKELADEIADGLSKL